MTEPFFGFVFNENLDDVTPPVLSDFSIIGLVVPSDDADSLRFPLDVPVSVNTGDPVVLAAMGTGPIYRAVQRINAQLGDLQVSAQAVIVRVATARDGEGHEDIAGTMANIVGDPAAGSGLYALLKAPQICGLTPRLIGAPGYTGATSYAATALAVTRPGHDYTHPVVTFTPPGATATATVGDVGVQATAHATLAAGGVGAIIVDGGGQHYDGAPAVTFSGGGGTGAAAHAIVSDAGVVDHIVIDSAGTGYTSAPAVTLGAPAPGEITSLTLTSPGDYPAGTTVTVSIADSMGGTGAGATASFTLELLANPVCAALPSICGKLLAHAIVGGPGTTKAAALAWRGTLNSTRLIPEDAWEIVADAGSPGGTGTVYIDGAAKSLGLAVRTDFQHGGFPFFSYANTPVQGALGLKRIDGFSLLDGATDGQELLAAGVGITVRGDAGDTSLDESGFVAVSLNNASSDTKFNFYSKTRGRDFIDLALIKTIRKRLGRENVNLHAVTAVLNDMEAVMADMPVDGVIGYRVGFKSEDNSAARLRAGKFTVYDNSEEAAPIVQITINRALDQPALTAELAALAATSAVA